MSTHKPPIVGHHESRPKTSSYIAGFTLSLILTLTTYLAVVNHWFSRSVLIVTIITLALAQFMIQLALFLHLGNESRPRWKLLVFGFMFMVVLIIVIGSIWIMDNLNYHTMTPDQLKHYLHTEEGI